MITLRQRNKLIFLIMLFIFLCALVALDIFVCIKLVGTKTAAGEKIVLSDDEPIEYKPLEILKLKKAMNDFLYNGFMLAEDSSNEISAAVVSAMSEARIPTKKMVAFSRFIKENENLILSFGNVGLGSFELLLDSEDVDATLMELLQKCNDGLKGFMTYTELTESEISLFLYSYLTKNTNELYTETAEKLGKAEFSALFVSTVKCLGAVCLSTDETLGATSATVLQNALYELGNNYVKTVDKIGADGIEILLFLQNDWAFAKNMSEAEIAELTEFKALAKGRFGDLLYLFGSTLKNLGASDYEKILTYRETEEGELKGRLYVSAYAKIASAVKSGLEALYDKEELDGDGEFIEIYGGFMKKLQRTNDLAAGVTDRDYPAFDETIDTLLTELLEGVNGLADKKDITETELENIGEDEFETYKIYADRISSAGNTVNSTVTAAFIVMYVNYLIKACSFEDILSKFQVTADEAYLKNLEQILGEMYG